jgi:hypothetical protein
VNHEPEARQAGKRLSIELRATPAGHEYFDGRQHVAGVAKVLQRPPGRQL